MVSHWSRDVSVKESEREARGQRAATEERTASLVAAPALSSLITSRAAEASRRFRVDRTLRIHR